MLTLKLKLREPTKHKLLELSSYCQEFSSCVNWYLKKCQQDKTTSRSKLHHSYYQEARHLFNLPSANIQVALDKAIEMERAYLRTKGKKTEPHLHSLIGCFRDDTIKVSDKAIRLTLNGKRLWFPVIVPERYKETLRLPWGRGEIKQVRDKWFLYLTVRDSPIPFKTSNILGVDLGLAKLATVSDVLGSVNMFFRGERAQAKRDWYAQKRQELQSKKDKGLAPNAWRALKRLAGKEQRYMTTLNHKISRAIVNKAIETKSAISIEHLEGIRERIKATKKVRRMLNNWNFRQLANFIEYKARLAGIPLVEVDPRRTSIHCPKCGNESRRNRKSQSSFKCSTCGYSLNADLLASRNIALRATSGLVNPSQIGCLTTPVCRSTDNLVSSF
jgi:IS605 OrfB family transposase